MDLAKRVVYQIYPKSFNDTTGNGFGDLVGIIEKLDYLKELGIDMLWLSPFYPSPQNDNGYDVSDYIAVDERFGTMEDFDRLMKEAQKRQIDIMLDMVFNHTSTEHQWFQKALAGDKYYQDFYYLKPPKSDGSLPTNWESKFGGPAWEKFGDTNLYYLHLYDVTQADLNWHNPNVRQALYDVIRFWIDKGVKGFRFDVLNVIGKEEFVDSEAPNSAQEKSLYTDTPIVHQWIKEMNQETFGQMEGFVTVGEMSSTSVPAGIRYTHPAGNQLSMIFSFHHLKVDYLNGEKWSNPPFDFIELKEILDEWQQGMSDGNGWNALFLNNHDQPRVISRFGDPENYPFESASMLAQTIQFLRGTPYLFQGEEIGMTNPNFSSIEDYRDIETHNNYQIMLDKGIPEAEALDIIQAKSRDNSRTPMQWNNKPKAGFTTGTPWIGIADNYPQVNAEKEMTSGKIFPYYQELIRLRKNHTVVSHGTYRGLMLESPEFMVYVRELENEEGKLEQLLIISHFYSGQASFDMPPEFQNRSAVKLIGNGALKDRYEGDEKLIFGPFETIAYHFT